MGTADVHGGLVRRVHRRGVTLGLIGALVGNEDLSRTLMALSMLLMIAMFLTSTYFIFRDSFVTDAEPTPQP